MHCSLLTTHYSLLTALQVAFHTTNGMVDATSASEWEFVNEPKRTGVYAHTEGNVSGHKRKQALQVESREQDAGSQASLEKAP